MPRPMSTGRCVHATAFAFADAVFHWSIGRPAHHRSTSDRGTSPTPIFLPLDNFKHSLTLFSTSFSSFPLGTCLLSVSRPYLALDRIHCPIFATFPNNPTRRQGLGPDPPLRTLLHTTIWTTELPDYKVGLFLVFSPLLRESL
ncbi:hypothetical protein R3W88_018672 [Solanum pinnatisectum]|uniref:Uncharacterized protein n=1 Tax=Solanum pinnatisectum TaxID=50273 RepID=A0AAV9KH39_9SOLN|nr:hypothetical protein R3W88_018672 [Solanum pinnatisectum]